MHHLTLKIYKPSLFIPTVLQALSSFTGKILCSQSRNTCKSVNHFFDAVSGSCFVSHLNQRILEINYSLHIVFRLENYVHITSDLYIFWQSESSSLNNWLEKARIPSWSINRSCFVVDVCSPLALTISEKFNFVTLSEREDHHCLCAFYPSYEGAVSAYTYAVACDLHNVYSPMLYFLCIMAYMLYVSASSGKF